MNGTNIEEARLELERERLVLEQRRAEREGGFLNRHFSAIITAMVSVATVVVTMTVYQTQIEVAKIHKSRELEVQQRESERQWKIEAARFIALHKSAIFSEDDRERKMMQHFITIAFPEEIGKGLLSEVVVFESSRIISNWLKPNGVRNRERWNLLNDWLVRKGFELSVVIFMYAKGFSTERALAVQELNMVDSNY